MEDVGTRFIASEPTTGMPTSASEPVSKSAFKSASAPPVNTPARIPTATRTSALVVCAYGWGKEVRLYADYLLVDGRHYLLQELLHVRCAYRVVLGVPSASLELYFKSKKLTLRGIAAIDDARRIVEYITPWCKSPDMAFHERDTHPVETPLPGEPRRVEFPDQVPPLKRSAGQPNQMANCPAP